MFALDPIREKSETAGERGEKRIRGLNASQSPLEGGGARSTSIDFA